MQILKIADQYCNYLGILTYDLLKMKVSKYNIENYKSQFRDFDLDGARKILIVIVP